MDLIERLEHEHAPHDHEVFQLTPPLFHSQACKFYENMGNPPVNFETFWDVYLQLLYQFQDANSGALAPAIREHFESAARLVDEEVPLLPDMQELRQGGKVVGEAAHADNHYESDISCASFTDDGDSEFEDTDAGPSN